MAYWDSGFSQSIDFFGDGPRIPMLILSPVFDRRKGSITTTATTFRMLKFIEHNWNLKPLTSRSRDNLPNPTFKNNNPYVPTNSPALSDLWDAFDFSKAVTQPYTE